MFVSLTLYFWIFFFINGGLGAVWYFAVCWTPCLEPYAACIEESMRHKRITSRAARGPGEAMACAQLEAPHARAVPRSGTGTSGRYIRAAASQSGTRYSAPRGTHTQHHPPPASLSSLMSHCVHVIQTGESKRRKRWLCVRCVRRRACSR